MADTRIVDAILLLKETRTSIIDAICDLGEQQELFNRVGIKHAKLAEARATLGKRLNILDEEIDDLSVRGDES